MTGTREEKEAALFAKLLVLLCTRNTFLEDLHTGIVPISKTGDYSDVKVIDGTGREIPWTELSRLNDEEMKKLIKECVNKTYTFLLKAEDEDFRREVTDRQRSGIRTWDEPELDKGFIRAMKRKAE